MKNGTADGQIISDMQHSRKKATEIKERLLEDSQQEEFDKNLDALSKIIEAKKHDEEKDLSMARQFESYRKAGLI